MTITIIISGMAGSGKTSLAKALANHYGFKYLCGGDALKEIAMRKGYHFSGDDWWETEDGMRFLSERKNNPDFDKEVDAFLKKKACEGSVAITSWALPWLGAVGVKIWLNAAQGTRAKRIMKRDVSAFDTALAAVKKRDIENIELYKRMYGYVLDKDRDVFDLVLETDSKTIDELKKEVVEFIDK
ncbi:MAG: AAA family ATPase [archaeon]|nr:AAA family ATPase [archaeon]